MERHSEASFSFTSCRHLPLSEEGHQPGTEISVNITAAVSKWLLDTAALLTALYCRPAELYLETDMGIMFPRASDGVSSECVVMMDVHTCALAE